MQKILTLIITAAILYMIFQHSVGRIAVPEHLKDKTEQNLHPNKQNQKKLR